MKPIIKADAVPTIFEHGPPETKKLRHEMELPQHLRGYSRLKGKSP